MKYPNPLTKGSTFGITAFSSGISPKHNARFECVTNHLKSQGFNIVVGDCLYDQGKHVSGSAKQRAEELMSMLLDDSIDAIYPPWGGEIAMELLPLIDFERLKLARPKWILGFSDVSTISATFACKLGWATGHCSNLMDLAPNAIDPLTSSTLQHFATPSGGNFTQEALEHYASCWPDFVNAPESGLELDTKTCWKWLTKPSHGDTIQGRLIGGCWDTLSHLFGTEYLDLKAMSEREPEGLILYLENAEMPPTEVARSILSMEYRGVFECINGLLIGRSAAPDETDSNRLSYYECLRQYLGDLPIPVMIDLDIGHKPPNLTLINGALASVSLSAKSEEHIGSITQTLAP
ncbi:LD-carboxypeptidase [Vibrio wakamikoensis]|uniref:S66 peptidase family protein n=1 Tax=Vibrio chaetopteri TaxID=3016528 RepID=A0AAU8BR57_9VIBR